MSTTILCSPCGYEDNIEHANKWCTNCEEGFCKDCEKLHRSTKMSRNHTIISVSDYQKIKDVAISQTCVGHGKRYDLYCSVHDKPLCIDCVDQHKSCSQLVSLDAVAANSKQSTALQDLEDTINGALQNVCKCIKNQEERDIELDKQESFIKKTVQKTREKLNQHLDLLEQKLIKNLSNKTIDCKSAFAKVIRQLNLADEKLSQLKKEMETMKQIASDAQIFLGAREMFKTVSEEIKSITSIINNIKCFEITIDINPAVASVLKSANQLGNISVIEKKSEFEFKDTKLDQAQKQVSTSSSINLQRKGTFYFGNTYAVSSCLILPNGHILIADFCAGNHLMEFDEQSQSVGKLQCSGKPYYLTLIDDDRIAVTYFSSKNIEIINLNSARIKIIEFEKECWGISYQDEKLYVVVEKGIVVLDLSGSILCSLPIYTKKKMPFATTKDRIYFTNPTKGSVHCISLTGQEIWINRNKSIDCPRGITPANDQDVFVVFKNDLSIIQQNGKENTILLRRTDGLLKPRAVYFNKDRRELLVCNEGNGHATLYKVSVA